MCQKHSGTVDRRRWWVYPGDYNGGLAPYAARDSRAQVSAKQIHGTVVHHVPLNIFTRQQAMPLWDGEKIKIFSARQVQATRQHNRERECGSPQCGAGG